LFLLGFIAVVSGYYAPLLHADSKTRLQGQYIFVYHENATQEHVASHAQTVGSANVLGMFDMGSSFHGFSAKLSEEMLDRLRQSPHIKFIEVDQVVTASQSCGKQGTAPWGLDRIDKPNADAMDDTFSYRAEGGGSVTSYIIDTGILISHTDFGGRAFWGINYAGDGQNTDCNGHGTHVAGTVGGTKFGVAKKTTLIAVKVLTCAGSGSNTGVINGINWVANDYKAKKKPSVANMSLGGTLSSATNAAVDAAVTAGVVMVVAAGNDQNDACKYSPASAKSAISVGATYTDASGMAQQDERASFSNFGTCVTLLAPGQMIDSAWHTSPTATKTISGTSMASPHVAGVAALYMSIVSPTPTPAQVKTFLTNNALNDQINLACTGLSTLCKQTPNKLLHLVCQ